ncbi:RAD51-associated protein 1 isoform X2 [Parambassis ranga]|uniref:RAD51-associated protein 1 isoform X2 n=1 Tax=Parambassis ranga TaxID=210632 RepID=A0A6P7HLG7_9TELE|nr:RAD51-associated protein 1 isoform X2 [Parambassis ranga]
MDRPPRKTKVVNYCEAKDFDDDEDFACVKAPPSKKAREDVKREPKNSSSKSSNQEANSQPTASRKPLDEKLLQRDLEAAITLSLLNKADGIKEQSPTCKGDVEAEFLVDENTDPASLHLSNCSVDGAVIEKGSPVAPIQRKAASKASEEQRNEDEDYEPKLTPDSESDEDFSEPDESEDEEFRVKKVSKTKKEKTTKINKDKTKPTPVAKKEKQPSKASKSKSQAAAFTPMRSPPAAKAAPKRPVSSSTASISKPAVSLSPAGGRIPKWNPPAQIGQSPTSSQRPAVRSPGLRLGLSRLVRVKPLHPSVVG